MTEEEIQIALSTYGTTQKSNIYAILKIISYPNEGTTVKMTFPKYKLVHRVPLEFNALK